MSCSFSILVSLALSIFAVISVLRLRARLTAMAARLDALERAPAASAPELSTAPAERQRSLSEDIFPDIDWAASSPPEPEPVPEPTDHDRQPSVRQTSEVRQGAEVAPPPQPEETSAPLFDERESAAPPAIDGASSSQPDWERWIGIRGAAVLGGAVLALAGLFFVKYWIDAGVLTPTVRVTLGFVGALGSLFASRFLRQRDYVPSANALAGASVVFAYGASWAGHSLYQLIPGPVTLFLFVLTTVLAGGLAWKHDAPVIAGLGLLGGFATPFVLESSGPVGLLALLVALNAGSLWLGRERRWRWLAIAGQLATLPHQLYWIYQLSRSASVPAVAQDAIAAGGWLALPLFVGLATLQLFGSSWMVSDGSEREGSATTPGTLMQLLSLGSPMLLASLLLLTVPSFPPFAMLLLMLLMTALSCFVGVVLRRPWFPMLVGLGAVVVHGVWWLQLLFLSHSALVEGASASGSAKLEAGGPALWSSLAVTAVLHLCFEVVRRNETRQGGKPAVVAVLSLSLPIAGMMLMTTLVYMTMPDFAFGSMLLASSIWLAMLLRQATSRGLCQGAFGWSTLAFGLVAPLLLEASGVKGALTHGGQPGSSLLLVLVFGALVGADLWSRSGLERGSIVPPRVGFVLVAALTGLFFTVTLELPLLLFVLGLGVLSALVILASREHRFAFVSPLLTVGASFVLFVHAVDSAGLGARAGWWFFSVVVLFTFALSFAPHLTLNSRSHAVRLTPSRGQWLGAGLAPLFFALPLLAFWEQVELEHPSLVMTALALLADLGFRAVRVRSSGIESVGARLARWTYGLVGAFWITLAALVEFDGTRLTIALTLLGFAGFLVWWRFSGSADAEVDAEVDAEAVDPWAPRVYFVGVLSFVALRLGWHTLDFLFDRPSSVSSAGVSLEVLTPVLSWLTPTFLLPASVFSTLVLALERRATGGHPRLVRWFGACAILAVFAWVNLTVIGAFEAATPFERLPMRDLLLSLSWGVFALALLTLGTIRDRLELRWVSLAFLLLTITKVFLYDLGELEDLWRVASLVGLAFSLLSVSLFYQRFVFRR